ncbi:glycosyltransferase family 4 protein [Olleya namhaensis]|uniref:Glycosyltransferase involved in cell wall bisynthesis n=1 Tax=Olleya namhaensis TaxID=1144750 RepID=A0A1I3NK57_9FLAO|nr:glycosyltransferase family 4 protein [Olleya namhaensis]SFJ09714.1 Glycosyltransferase involved in cell wall bisynthesis [Olleya namhaensis]
MKIAFLTPEYPHERIGHSGGIGTSIKHLAVALQKQGHEVSLLIYGQEEDVTFSDNGIAFYKIKNPKLKGLSWFLTRKKIQKLINRLHKAQKIDIVEAPDWTGIASFININCPLIIRENGSDTYFCHLDHRPVKAINRFHEKQALKSVDGIISVSQFTGELTNKLFNLSKPFTVIPNAVNIEDFEPTESLLEEKNQTILYFGTLIRKKGLLELPYIFNKVNEHYPEATLILVGKDSPDIKTQTQSTWQLMQPLFTESALKRVNYVGVVPYSKMRLHIEKATLCVFPTFAEALPVSWLEAMALKKPIVASNVGWAKEIVDDGEDGFLVHPEAHDRYANKINALLENATLRDAFSIAARKKIISKFSSEIVAKQSVEFYKKTIDANSFS